MDISLTLLYCNLSQLGIMAQAAVSGAALNVQGKQHLPLRRPSSVSMILMLVALSARYPYNITHNNADRLLRTSVVSGNPDPHTTLGDNSELDLFTQSFAMNRMRTSNTLGECQAQHQDPLERAPTSDSRRSLSVIVCPDSQAQSVTVHNSKDPAQDAQQKGESSKSIDIAANLPLSDEDCPDLRKYIFFCTDCGGKDSNGRCNGVSRTIS